MPKGPRKLTIAFGNETLTHYGGTYLLHRFLTQIGFKNAVAMHVRLIQRNNRYTVGEILLALLYPMILGLERIETTYLLQPNGVFRYLSGLPTYPNPSTLRRFLLRLAPQALPRLRRLHDRFLAQMTVKPHLPSRLIFDLDSTVLVLYGKQEEARVGYNPIKHGRPSYHPLLCFEGQTKDFWHGELRPGDVHTSSGVLELLKACFAKIPAGVRYVIIRADKGFYDHKTIEWLEERKAHFVIVAKLTRPIKRKLAHLPYAHVSLGVEAAEFRYQPTRWPHPYRFVVIRRPQPEEPNEQLTLFKLGKYHYQVLVTNLHLQPLNLWRFYNGRAGVERIIRELKGDYPLGKIPTRHFFANEAYFHLLLLAYNLVNWFKRLCLPEEFQTATLQTLRNRILLMPAQLLRTDNRPRLAMPPSGPREAAWKYALHKIEKLKL
ncbi:IS1380 family transposase [bacterium]|nr:MAG: IS1380 family transposase [bacterium]